MMPSLLCVHIQHSLLIGKNLLEWHIAFSICSFICVFHLDTFSIRVIHYYSYFFVFCSQCFPFPHGLCIILLFYRFFIRIILFSENCEVIIKQEHINRPHIETDDDTECEEVDEDIIEHPGLLCRLCASNIDEMVLIFSESGREQHIAEKINMCLPVTVSCIYKSFCHTIIFKYPVFENRILR